jgi:hypothetical protein
MKRMIAPIGAILIIPMLCLSQTQIETEPVKELHPTGSLATCKYKPTAGETAFYQKLAPAEQSTGSIIEDYDIHQKDGFVSWYGIVRGISKVKDTQWSLLLEHKFFDGMTDCHIMLVDIGGSGDFCAEIEAADMTIPALALVRVYGTIRGQDAGTPVLAAEFVRVWPWMTFTFSNLMSKDRTNPRWKDLRSLNRRRIYNPWPNEGYYRAILGDPKDAGLSLKDPR